MPSNLHARGHRIVVLHKMRQHLGVAVAREQMTRRLQRLTQRTEIVDLAVEDSADVPVLVRDRRIARDEVDDRQAVLADDGPAAVEITLRVRPAMALRRQLGRYRPREPIGIELHRSADPAHALTLSDRAAWRSPDQSHTAVDKPKDSRTSCSTHSWLVVKWPFRPRHSDYTPTRSRAQGQTRRL